MKRVMLTLCIAVASIVFVGHVEAGTLGDTTINGDLDVTGTFSLGLTSPVWPVVIFQNTPGAVGSSYNNSDTGTTTNDGFYFGLGSDETCFLFNREATNLILGTNNLSRMTITPSGSVGIGTTNPVWPFVVFKSGGNAVGAAFQNSDTGSTTNDGFFFGIGGDEVTYLYNRENTDMVIGTNNLARIYIKSDGKIGIGVSNPTKLLEVAGEAKVDVLNIAGADLCEHFDVRVVPGKGEGGAEPGTVVSIDVDNPGQMVVSSKAYDRTVAGIISGAGGLKPGVMMGQDDSTRGEHPVALTGRVYCKVDATHAPVVPGDLLTTSNTPGHAMKVTDYGKAQGAIIGKAMTPLEKGKGLVLVLVTLQ